MSLEILMPFGLTPSGEIASTSDPGIQTQQHVDSLVGTRPGERVMLPGYGVDAPVMLFGQAAAIVQQSLITDVRQAMAQYEPGVSVLSVEASRDADPAIGQVGINVEYVTSGPNGSTAPAVTTATVLAGGTVIETAV